MTEIVGISLVRNEDRFVAWALNNVAAFCDRIMVLDNQSHDGTMAQLRKVQQRHRHVHVEAIRDINDSHSYVESYAGRDCWVMAIDGDEIYDPMGLREIRQRIMGGEFNASWALVGNCFHCEHLDIEPKLARGYMSPPGRPVTKLYNFAALESWVGCGERLHVPNQVFKPGYGATMLRRLCSEQDWDHAVFRCLHLCFMSRSTADNSQAVYARLTPGDRGNLSWFGGVVNRLFPARYKSAWKLDKYKRGPCVEKAYPSFLREGKLEQDAKGFVRYVDDESR